MTDRKKSLRVLANGKKVAPAPIENKLKSSPLIAEIKRLSEDLADFENVRRSKLPRHEFTIEAGELTPTLRLKRKAVLEHCAGEIASMTS